MRSDLVKSCTWQTKPWSFSTASVQTHTYISTCIRNLSRSHTTHSPHTYTHRNGQPTWWRLDVHGVCFLSTPTSRGSRWTCSPCLKASVWWSRSPHSWCWLWIGATGWRSRREKTGSGGPVRPQSAPRRSLVGTTGTFCSCWSSSCRVRRRMALGAWKTM